jgi:hypothetical protein
MPTMSNTEQIVAAVNAMRISDATPTPDPYVPMPACYPMGGSTSFDRKFNRHPQRDFPLGTFL